MLKEILLATAVGYLLCLAMWELLFHSILSVSKTKNTYNDMLIADLSFKNKNKIPSFLSPKLFNLKCTLW